MRKSKAIGFGLAAILLLGACTAEPAVTEGAGAGTYLEPPAVTYPEAPAEGAELDAPDTAATIGPLELPNRWVPLPDSFANAQELVDSITMGWNLGNTLDANVGTSPASIRNNSPERQETHWMNPITEERLILMVRDAGFNAIRIPVTWFAMVDEDLNIREDWMDRVQEVVDYGYQNGMIVVLNTHHDESMWSLYDADVEESKAVIEKMWTQISERFEPYGQRLVFEGLNEPRTVGTPAEWAGGTPEERNNLNILNQVFVDTVRATGGNNAERFLIATPYGASSSAAAIEGFVLPEDPAGPDKQIVSIHMYVPYRFAISTESDAVAEWSPDGEGDSGPDIILEGLDRAYETFVEHGIPVIFGEMGAQNRNNTEARIAWVDFYVRQARERGMRTFWWDNGGIGMLIAGVTTTDSYALFNRRVNIPSQPEIIDAIMRAVEETP